MARRHPTVVDVQSPLRTARSRVGNDPSHCASSPSAPAAQGLDDHTGSLAPEWWCRPSESDVMGGSARAWKAFGLWCRPAIWFLLVVVALSGLPPTQRPRDQGQGLRGRRPQRSRGGGRGRQRPGGRDAPRRGAGLDWQRGRRACLDAVGCPLVPLTMTVGPACYEQDVAPSGRSGRGAGDGNVQPCQLGGPQSLERGSERSERGAGQGRSLPVVARGGHVRRRSAAGQRRCEANEERRGKSGGRLGAPRFITSSRIRRRAPGPTRSRRR